MTSPRLINVLVVDDYESIRASLGRFISVFQDLYLVGIAVNGKEAIESCSKLQPDLILMDVDMPILNGIEATRVITRQWPHITIIGLTGFEEQSVVDAMLKAGAHSCMTKATPIAELYRAIITSTRHLSDRPGQAISPR